MCVAFAWAHPEQVGSAGDVQSQFLAGLEPDGGWGEAEPQGHWLAGGEGLALSGQ